jgi:hypothetical protein
MPSTNRSRHLLLTAISLLTALVLPVLAPSSARAQQPASPTRAQIEAATYPVPVAPGGTATLVGGKFEVAAAPGSASKVTATLVNSANGVIGGQPGAAVVLATSGGGSGTFFELYVVDVTAKTVARVSLGDRIRLDGLSVSAAGQVAVAMGVQAPGDPLCCATGQQTRFYELQKTPAGTFDLVLVRTATAVVDPARPAPPRPATTGTGGIDAVDGVSTPFAALVLVSVLLASAAAHVAAGRGCRR